MRRAALFALVCYLPITAIFAAEVRLTVEEPAGVERQQWPVSSGIPLAQGALRDDQAAALFDAAGREVPLQTETLARWPDGSVRWLLLDFQIDLAAKEKKTLTLRYGADVRRAAVENPVRVTKQADGTVVIEPGPVRLEYDAKRRLPFFFPQGKAIADRQVGGRRQPDHRGFTYQLRRLDGILLSGRWPRSTYFGAELQRTICTRSACRAGRPGAGMPSRQRLAR